MGHEYSHPSQNYCHIVDKEMVIPGPVESKDWCSRKRRHVGMARSLWCNQRSFHSSQCWVGFCSPGSLVPRPGPSCITQHSHLCSQEFKTCSSTTAFSMVSSDCLRCTVETLSQLPGKGVMASFPLPSCGEGSRKNCSP